MFKFFSLTFLVTVVNLLLTAYPTIAKADVENDGLLNAYGQLIQAEHQLLKSELAVEAEKSASFEKLLADGHASWLENRQQKLVVDISKAKLAAFEKFESQANQTLTVGSISFKTNFGVTETASSELRQTAIKELQKELTTLRQRETKLAHGISTVTTNASWVKGYRMRHALIGDQADVVAAKIVLLKKIYALQDQTNIAFEFVSATDRVATVDTVWKRPAKDLNSLELLISQANLQIQLSQHHLLNENRRLNSLLGLANRGMATQRSIAALKNKIGSIDKLLKEQQDNLSWLKKDLDDSSITNEIYTSVRAGSASGVNNLPNKTQTPQSDLHVLSTLLNRFEVGQASYLREEAILKGEFYREVLSKLEQAVSNQTNQFSNQTNQTNATDSTAGFSNVLVRGQQRELEQYRWKIKKTELQRDLADAQIALLKESDGSHSDNLNMLVSTRVGSSIPVTLPSRFITSDPFGLQTAYSAFVFHSPKFREQRPALATRGDYSSVLRPVINRNALSYYRGLQSSGVGSSYGRFGGSYLNGSFHAGFRTFRPPGRSPFQFPGSPQTFNFNRFHGSSRFNSFGRSSGIYQSSGPGYYGY